MEIVYVVPKLTAFGGTIEMPRNIANILGRKHNCTIIGSTMAETSVETSLPEKFEKIVLDYKKGWFERKLWLFEMRKIINKKKPDLVIAEPPFLPWLPKKFKSIVWARKPITCFRVAEKSLKLDCTRCQDWKTNAQIFAMEKILRNTPIICNSRFTFEHCLSERIKKNQFLIYNGVDTGMCKEMKKKSQLLYLGRIFPGKGIDVMINAFKLIEKKSPKTRLVIAGIDLPEHMLKYKRMALGSNIDFVGYVEGKEKWRLLNESSVNLLPTISACAETFGIGNAEAMACKTPVVASNVGGVSEVVEHEKTGFLVQPKNERALAEKALELLEDRFLAKKMGLRARERVLKNFDIKKIAGQHEKLYEKILGESRRGKNAVCSC